MSREYTVVRPLHRESEEAIAELVQHIAEQIKDGTVRQIGVAIVLADGSVNASWAIVAKQHSVAPLLGAIDWLKDGILTERRQSLEVTTA